MRAVAVCVCICASVASAVADPKADELRAHGEKLAKDGRYSEAIAAFKAADKLTPRATNWCLIGLAYTRRELWPQAEIAIDRCKQLASSADPLPSWLPALETQLSSRLAAVDVAAVEISVEPADVAADLTVSSFAPDETFHARVIHLPFGHHVISASAAGYPRADVAIDISNRTPQHVVLKLHATVAAPPEVAPTPAPVPVASPVPVAPPPAEQPRRLAPWIVIGAGAALAIAGGIVEATWFKSAHDQLASDMNTTAYNNDAPAFDTRRDVVIGLYAAGAIAAGVGVVLELMGRDERGAQVSVAPIPGGSIVSLGWSR